MDDAPLVELATWMTANLPQLIARSAAAIREQIPSYGEETGADVAENTRRILLVVIDCLKEHRPPRAADLEDTAVHAARRVEHGIELTDFLRAFRVSQAALWTALVEMTRSRPQLGEAVLVAAGILMETVEIGSSIAGEAHQAETRLAEAGDSRVQRRLLEDLLVGNAAVVAGHRELLKAFDLSPESRVVVGVGSMQAGATVSVDAIAAVRSALAADLHGLVVIRREDIVGVVPVDSTGEARAIARVSSVVGSLSLRGLPVGVGLSTAHEGLGTLARALEEAQLARSTIAGTGVQSLGSLSLQDYLVLRPDPTAVAMVPAQIRTFVEQDLATGGIGLETLQAYVAADMNAKAAASVLHVHVNTVYYRLERIAEATGKDLRRVAEVTELLLSVRLLSPAHNGLPGGL